MIRTAITLAVLLTVGPSAFAQFLPRPGPRVAPRPAGVIQPPSLPFPGSGGVPSPTPMRPPLQRPGLLQNPFYGALGYGYGYGYDPFYYESEPLVPPAAPAPAPTTIIVNSVAPAPPPPEELKARLALSVPVG